MEHLIDIQPVILAAGKGTRMGIDVPKVLFTINGEPMVIHLLNQLRKLPGMKPPIIVIGYRYELIQARLGSEFLYAFQQGQLGTAHAVGSAKRQNAGNHVLILNGDMPFIKPESINNLIKNHKESKATFSMLVTQVPHFEKEYAGFKGLGRVIRDGKKVEKIVEFVDATEEQRATTEVNPGVYLVEAKWLWEHLEQIQPNNKQKEYYLTDIVSIANKKKIPIQTQTVTPWEVFGINTKAQLKQAEEMANLI